jgi:RNA polymerase sigma factor (sigma-70 family)
MQEHKRWTDENEVSDTLLLKHWSRLTHYLSHRVGRSYSFTQEDEEDLVSTIQWYLLRMSPEMRPCIGYCRATITSAVRSCIRDTLRRGGTPQNGWKVYQTVDFNTASPGTRGPHAEDSDGSALMDSVIPIPESPEPDLTDSIMLSKAMSKLTARECDVVRLYYWQDMSLTDVGEHIGVSRETVRCDLKFALDKLRRVMKPA